MSEPKFKVSALTFRPQKFSDVVSQEFVTKTLINAIKSKKIAHSYLFSGPRGVGKTTIARIFAKAINCKNAKDGEPCNDCENCTEITRGVHPDVFELDAASNRGIDDVRSIQDAAKYFPIKADYKFYIVDEVHMLTIQAFNALLKILEEPPEYLIFILATTNPERIPPTIVSRCQRFGLHRLKITEIMEQLEFVAKEQNVKIDRDSLFLVAKLGDGALRDSLGVFDMAVSYCGNKIKFEELKEFLNLPDNSIYFNTSRYIVTSDIKSIIAYFNELEESGLDIITYLNGITDHYRNLLIVKTTEKADLLDESDDTKKKFLEEAKSYSVDQIQRILKLLFDSEQRFKFSGNQKVLMESLLVELCRINREVVDISELISGLETLKKKSLR
ncbi:MAG: DNA polymerase III subunit gamma/tau [Ignavibacteria bacterium]